MTEDALHFAVIDFLRVALPPQVVFHHSPNEGKRGPRAQVQMKRRGTRAGWPDIEILHEGRFYGIELKSPQNKRGTTATQDECHDGLNRAGCLVAVCRSLDDVIGTLMGWGIPLKAVAQ